MIKELTVYSFLQRSGFSGNSTLVFLVISLAFNDWTAPLARKGALQSPFSLGRLPASRFGYDSPVGGNREARRDRRSGLVLIGLLSSRLFLGIADDHLNTFGSASLEFRDRVTNRSNTYVFLPQYEPWTWVPLLSPWSRSWPARPLLRFNTKNHF